VLQAEEKEEEEGCFKPARWAFLTQTGMGKYEGKKVKGPKYARREIQPQFGAILYPTQQGKGDA
jgi:hypothetical protein